MSKVRTVKGVGWDVSALGNGKCHITNFSLVTSTTNYPYNLINMRFKRYFLPVIELIFEIFRS